MKYTKVREDTCQDLQLNAGIILTSFDPSTATVADEAIAAATSGGVTFNAVPEYKDYGADIDNVPDNTKELMKRTMWSVKMSGVFAAINQALIKLLIASCSADSTGKITPAQDLKAEDFKDLWWVGDYSDKNGQTNGGMLAIHMLNTLSTGGFNIQSTDEEKGKFSFEFTAHYSLSARDTVPFEVYIKAGTDEPTGG